MQLSLGRCAKLAGVAALALVGACAEVPDAPFTTFRAQPDGNFEFIAHGWCRDLQSHWMELIREQLRQRHLCPNSFLVWTPPDETPLDGRGLPCRPYEFRYKVGCAIMN
jgi:hypothetical protein